jgi:hypothetical protein
MVSGMREADEQPEVLTLLSHFRLSLFLPVFFVFFSFLLSSFLLLFLLPRICVSYTHQTFQNVFGYGLVFVCDLSKHCSHIPVRHVRCNIWFQTRGCTASAHIVFRVALGTVDVRFVALIYGSSNGAEKQLRYRDAKK